jgi:hypothetical protein
MQRYILELQVPSCCSLVCGFNTANPDHMNEHSIQTRKDFRRRATWSSYAGRRASTSFPACSFNCMTKSLPGSFFIPTTPALSVFFTTRCSIAAFAVVQIFLRSVGFANRTLTCRSVALSLVGGGGWLAILAAHVGLFEVVEVVGGVVAAEEALPSLRTALHVCST